MAEPLPPWLNVQPAQFAQAAEAGARAGLQARIAAEQNQRMMEEAALRRHAEEQQKQIRQFELEARIKESAARMANADVRNRMAQVQAERQMRADALGAMAKQAQLDIARQALGLKQKQFEKEQNPFVPTTTTVDGVRLANVRPNAWVVAPEKSAPELTPSQIENLSLGYRRMLRDLEKDKNDPLKMVPQESYDAQKQEYQSKLDQLKQAALKLGTKQKTPVESGISLPNTVDQGTEGSVQELIYDSNTKSFKPAGE